MTDESMGVMLRKIRAIRLLGDRCTMCGYNAHPRALEFHHRSRADKEHGPAYLITHRTRNEKWWPVLEAELQKCDLLCACCHRLVEHRLVHGIKDEGGAGTCEMCGYEALVKRQLDVHHRDHNHQNNDPTNHQIVCANCHGVHHTSWDLDGHWPIEA